MNKKEIYFALTIFTIVFSSMTIGFITGKHRANWLAEKEVTIIMSDPLGIKQDDWNADHYAHVIKSWGLNDIQMKVLKIMMDDIYMDGWGDGVAHKTSLTPDEFRERITNDIKNSWMRLIIEGVDK